MSTSAFTQRLVAQFQPVAAGSSFSTAIAKVPFNGTVSRVAVIPNATLTGANTNTRKHEIINKALNGAGTDVVASLQYDAGISLAAFDEKTLTNSATAANLDVDAGEVLAIVSSVVGTGLADGGGIVIIELARRT